MTKRNVEHPTPAAPPPRLRLLTLFSCIALLAIPKSALSHAGGVGEILVWSVVFLGYGLVLLVIIALWLVWLALLSTCCKRLYLEVFQDRSSLPFSLLLRSTFWELLICQSAVWIPAGLLILQFPSGFYWSVLAIAAGTLLILLAVSYNTHRLKADDQAQPHFDGFIVPVLTAASSLPALALWMTWGSPSNYFMLGIEGLLWALLVLLLPILLVSEVKALLYKSVSGDVAPLSKNSVRIVGSIEALLIPISWLWAVALTGAMGFLNDEGISIPIIINAFCSILILATFIQAVLTVAPNLCLLWPKGRTSWTPIFSSLAPAAAVALLFALVAVDQPVGSSKSLDMALLKASPMNGSRQFSRLLKMGANPNGTIGSGEPLLLAAIKRRRWTIAEALLQNGSDANGKDGAGRTALEAAVEKLHPGMVKLLLDNGADPNSSGRKGNSVLLSAIGTGHSQIIVHLLDKGADPKTRDKQGNTALMIAVLKRQPDIVRLLLERGADHSAKSYRDQTALMAAIRLRHRELVALLLEAGADPNVKFVGDQTAIATALEKRQWGIGELLAQKGADLNTRDSSGCPLLLATLKKRKWETAKWLLEKGADVNSKEHGGLTALMEAVERGQMSITELLVENGADVNARTERGRTALMYAIQHGEQRLVKLLVENGADINVQDKKGSTPLMGAISGRRKIVARLMRQADYNRRTSGGSLKPLEVVKRH